MGLSVVILAAGQGTRMKSNLPKVLHPLGGRPLVAHVLATARSLNPDHIHVVYGHGGERVFEAIEEAGVERVLQAEQRGTGHALLQALPGIDDADTVLVLFADVPLISSQTLQALIQGLDQTPLALLTVILRDPQGYGRILRDDTGQVVKIVEERDADPIERKINEVNTGIMAARAADFKRWLAGVDTDNAQGEYYLTDCVALGAAEGGRIKAVVSHDPHEVAGVNDKIQLAELERVFQRRQAQALMREGVSLADPARIDVRGELNVGRDVWIDINVVIEGEVRLGDGVRIGANCVILDSQIDSGTEILPHSHIQGAHIGPDCSIGPYARIRPETVLHEGAKVGNFVEIKKSVVREHSKINHLSYIGDSEVGRRVNVGAGTITCNYDGANKHKTVIGDDAFIGSDTQLVAPVSIGAGATIGAGSTITKDTPAAELTLSRSKQITLKGWQRPRKKKD